MQKTVAAFVRLGYIAKAVVYVLVGVLALKVAVGARGGRITDQGGALYVVLGQPLGQTLLIVLAAGLLTYASWQIVRAIFGWDHHRHEGWGDRALTIVRALVYAGIGVTAMKLGFGLRAGESGPEPLVRQALQWPLGEWLIAIAGLGVGWYGLVEIRDAIQARLEPDLDAGTLRRRAGNWALQVARGGIGARGVLVLLLGVGLVRAALERRTSEASGLDRSLVILNSLPQGTVLLGLAAAGVFAYGIYQFLHARYAEV
ncbi:MAG TPA: DUF1206 domain-containing protein [Vicinamibacterales bacterium]|nr:DUF1206 domain-containing protein [Vicinamibacterales bacterium]